MRVREQGAWGRDRPRARRNQPPPGRAGHGIVQAQPPGGQTRSTQCRCRATLAAERRGSSAPAQREAAGARAAWSRPSRYPARPRCSCDAGTADTSQKAGAHRIRIRDRGGSQQGSFFVLPVRCQAPFRGEMRARHAPLNALFFVLRARGTHRRAHGWFVLIPFRPNFRTRKLVNTPRCSILHRDQLLELVGLWIPEVEGTVFASKKSPSR